MKLQTRSIAYVLTAICVASAVLSESLPRNMLTGKHLDLFLVLLCVTSLLSMLLHLRLSNKSWLVELGVFMLICPVATTLTYFVYDYRQMAAMINSLPNSLYFLIGPPVLLSALYGMVVGTITISLERIGRRAWPADRRNVPL
jgi:hypothetical protein